MTVKLWQIWKRKNGRLVRLTEEREVNGLKEYKLTPLTTKGRIVWKYGEHIPFDLELYRDTEETP